MEDLSYPKSYGAFIIAGARGGVTEGDERRSHGLKGLEGFLSGATQHDDLKGAHKIGGIGSFLVICGSVVIDFISIVLFILRVSPLSH